MSRQESDLTIFNLIVNNNSLVVARSVTFIRVPCRRGPKPYTIPYSQHITRCKGNNIYSQLYTANIALSSIEHCSPLPVVMWKIVVV